MAGTRSVRITISQVFRLLDLVSHPDKLREDARDLGTFWSRHRRALSQRQTFNIPALGALRPVGGEDDEYGGFWRTAVSTLRSQPTPSILFIPLELSLASRLDQLQPSLQSVLDESLGKNEDLVENRQVSGRLRIYPPGVGVSRIAITLTFKKEVHVEAVAQIAHDIEELVFINPADKDSGKPCEALLQETIDEVVKFLFGEEYLDQERRWRPPDTIYSFPGVTGEGMEESVSALAYLLYMTVGNEEFESESGLEQRLLSALRSKHWITDKVLALASQRGFLFMIGDAYAAGRKNKQQRLREWLAETSELIWVASYAAQGFAENIGEIAQLRLLNDEYLPDKGPNFANLEALLQSMRSVLRAIEVARSDVRKLGEGLLGLLARDLWRSNNSVNAEEFRVDMQYISEWLKNSTDQKMKDLLACADDIVKLADLFLPVSWGKLPN